jgi:hypothetical protein
MTDQEIIKELRREKSRLLNANEELRVKLAENAVLHSRVFMLHCRYKRAMRINAELVKALAKATNDLQAEWEQQAGDSL